jgi:hypothetical protein
VTIAPPVAHTTIDTAAWGIPITNAVNALTDTPRIYPVGLGALNQGGGWATPAGGNTVPVTPARARRWLIVFAMVAGAASPVNAVGFARITVNGAGAPLKQATLNLTNPSSDVTWLTYFAGAINTVAIEYTAANMAASVVYYLDCGPV